MLSHVLLLLLIHSSQSTVNDFNIITWNMQGACSGGVYSWTRVQQMMNRGAQIVALQEAGTIAILPTDNLIPNPVIRNPDGVNASLTSYVWNTRFSRYPNNVYLYFLNLDDDGANRVNLAFVTAHPANELILLHPNNTFGRPILGIGYGFDAFFNIHAISRSGGPDGPSLVNRVYRYVATRLFLSWMMLGDFNREPEDLMQRLNVLYPDVVNNVFTVNQRQPTQRSGGNLDYGVAPVTLTVRPRAVMPDTRFSLSDHNPVHVPSSSCS